MILINYTKKVHICAFLLIEMIFKLWEYGLPYSNLYSLLDIQVATELFLSLLGYTSCLFLNIGWIIIINKNDDKTIIIWDELLLFITEQK